MLYFYIFVNLKTYSPIRSTLGAIFLIFKDSRHTIPKADSTIPTPAATVRPTGITNVHFTMPIPLKNTAVRGFITKLLATSPTAVENMTDGIKLAAV